MTTSPHPVVLVILDGFGIAPPSRGNAISLAKTPFLDHAIATYPSFTLHASGELVGLPWGEMGNSEVGHLSIGSGRIVYQSFPRITRAIADGSFFDNDALRKVAAHVQFRRSQLHLLGLVSDGGVHSSIDHLFALLEFCKGQGIDRVAVHAFLDGRDTSRNSGKAFLAKLLQRMGGLGVGTLASISGRYYAMDRDRRWDRVEKAYRAIVEGRSSRTSEDPLEAIERSYGNHCFDEEFEPTVILKNGHPVAVVQENDGLIFFNFRPDRARELTEAFVMEKFDSFPRTKIPHLFFVSMTEYEKDFPVDAVCFPPEEIARPLAKVIADQGWQQLHVAETEKYPHVTYFLNGGRENAFPGERRILIPSPPVASYDEKPEMAAMEIRDETMKEIRSKRHTLVVINFANADMVGHTGNLPATRKAIEVLDECLKEVIRATLEVSGIAVIIGDHGNAEEMLMRGTGEIDKEHSKNPVPFLLIGHQWAGRSKAESRDLSYSKPIGILADIAPTILTILGLSIPQEMTGRSLIEKIAGDFNRKGIQ